MAVLDNPTLKYELECQAYGANLERLNKSVKRLLSMTSLPVSQSSHLSHDH